jgi:hypothetical protein
MLYGLTPLIILTALYIPEKPHLKPVFIPLFLLIIALIALPTLVDFLLPNIKDPQLQAALTSTFSQMNSSYLLVLGLILGCSIWLFSNKHWPHQGRLLSAGLVSTFVISEFLLPLVAEIQQEPIKQAGTVAANFDEPAVIWRLNTPSFSIYSNKIAPKRKPVTGELVLTKSHYLDELPDREILFEKNGIALALVTAKEVSDVSSITTHIEPPLLMVNSSVGVDIGTSDTSAPDESITVPTDQYAGNHDHRTGIMGNSNHSRGRTSGNRTPSASTQEKPKVNHYSLGFRPGGSHLGAFAESGIRGTEATRSYRYADDYRTWPRIQKREFSIRPYIHSVRNVRVPGFLDERPSTEIPLPISATAGFSGSPIAKCCRYSLAARYHDRYGNRLAFSNSRKSAHANFNYRRYNQGLGWTIPHYMLTLPPSCIRYGLYRCQGIPTQHSPFCARDGLHGRFKNDQACIVPNAFLKNRG